jgi:hypothetical protein
MTQEEKIHQLESKLSDLEMKVEFINKRFGLLPDQDEFDFAMEALMARDPKPLDDYLKRGGKIPTDCQRALL